jgi:hypothetical protein
VGRSEILVLIAEGRIWAGMTKADIRRLLGPPQAWGNTSRRYSEPSVWAYEGVEFWFERRPYRIPWPGPKLIGVYRESPEDGTGQMLLGGAPDEL